MSIEFNTVIHRFSTTSGVAPSPTELYPGELALNLADGSLFTLNMNGVVIDLTGINSLFNFTGSFQGYLLTYDEAVGQYIATNPKEFLDGGTY